MAVPVSSYVVSAADASGNLQPQLTGMYLQLEEGSAHRLMERGLLLSLPFRSFTHGFTSAGHGDDAYKRFEALANACSAIIEAHGAG